MTVYKRNSSPFWQIEFKYLGERVRRSSGTTKKREAQELERRLRQDIHDRLVMGKIVEMSLEDAIERYYATAILPKGKPDTAQRDRYVLDGLKVAFGPETPLTKLTAPIISNYRDDTLQSGKAPATVNRYLATLKAILNKAKSEWGALTVVPTIKLLPLNNERYRWLTDDEEQRLLSVSAPHLRNLIIFLIDTGARKGEALGLTWADVDLERSPRPVVKFMDTKSGKPRGVPLTRRVEVLLRTLKRSQHNISERVFLYTPNGKSTPIPFRQPHGAWKAACRRAGIEDTVMHDLRHTFASRLVMRGVQMLPVSKLLGHADIKMTMRYAHLAPDAFDEAISTLEANTV